MILNQTRLDNQVAVITGGTTGIDKTIASKDPSPEGPALVHPRGVMKMATFTNSA